MSLLDKFYRSQSLQICTVILLYQSSLLVKGHETDMNKELILTYQEKVTFDKFKSQVIANVSKSPPAHPFMRTDLFLLRWIRAKNLDVNLAIRDMHECLEWRRVNQLHKIQQENWDDIIEEHPYNMDVIDLQGRPVGMGSIGGKWNIRRQMLSGRQQKMKRYAYKLVEEVFDRTYQINKKHPNITQFSVIASLEGFNIIQQACPLCLATYVQLLTTYNRFYPSFAHAIIAINTPPSFSIVLDLVRPMLNKPTRDALRIYSYNQREWKPVLDQEVSPDQRTREFGGTRSDDDEYN